MVVVICRRLIVKLLILGMIRMVQMLKVDLLVLKRDKNQAITCHEIKTI